MRYIILLPPSTKIMELAHLDIYLGVFLGGWGEGL